MNKWTYRPSLCARKYIVKCFDLIQHMCFDKYDMDYFNNLVCYNMNSIVNSGYVELLQLLSEITKLKPKIINEKNLDRAVEKSGYKLSKWLFDHLKPDNKEFFSKKNFAAAKYSMDMYCWFVKMNDELVMDRLSVSNLHMYCVYDSCSLESFQVLLQQYG